MTRVRYLRTEGAAAKAVNNILVKEKPVIAVRCLGCNVGQKGGRITLVVVGCWDGNVYIFDVLKCPKIVYDGGVLRLLQSAEFLIHNADTICPAFVYDGDLRSVRKLMSSSFCSKREVVPELLVDIACGLEYLHNKGMVHMELSQDTITVDEDGYVRLTGACLPRKANLPMYTESVETGDFVHLAPEVLKGSVYEPTADIYSFGLLVLELAHYKIPEVFQKERKMTLYDFARNVDPEQMLNLEHNVKIFTIKTRALIENCLQLNKYDRPQMSEIVEYAAQIKTEKEALDKFPTRRSRPVVKRPSMDQMLGQSTKL